jgi:ABC-type Mn2+/Zn2+ transport system ATPase subunit
MSRSLVKVERHDLWSPAKILLQRLDLQLQPGEILFLQGPNGSGKSTFLRELFAVLTRQRKSNSIQISGVRSFSFLPQSLNREFFIPLSLGEVAGLATPPQSAVAVETLNVLLPGKTATHMWNVASGGEKQRALLTQALSQHHLLYLLDEPFNHLDEDSVEVASTIIKTRANAGAAFLIATHTVPTSLNSGAAKTLHFAPNGEVQ